MVKSMARLPHLVASSGARISEGGESEREREREREQERKSEKNRKRETM